MSRTLLIVSPHFPPINAPDMQRVRMSLPYFEATGWRPVVLAVDPRDVEGVHDELLLETIPPHIPVRRVRALSTRWTRRVGIGNLALRAWPLLYLAGCDLIKKYHVDLVYFSTTMFLALPLGRIWKARLGVPFVVDMQDPWFSDYYEKTPQAMPPPKYGLARQLHRHLEPWTMQAVAGLIAVSDDYITTLHHRYPWLQQCAVQTLPFGAAEQDFRLLQSHPQPNHFFRPHSGQIHGVYVGRGGSDMTRALRIMFVAFARGLAEQPALFSRMQLHFIGTDYAPAKRVRKTVEPLAREIGIEQHITEHPVRIPYFEALQLLLDADFLLVPGSDDPQYTASKIYPYILANKPLLAVFHEQSSVVELIAATDAGTVVSFSDHDFDDAALSNHIMQAWYSMLQPATRSPAIHWDAFRPYTAQAMTERQSALFNKVVETTS
jgi:hypothetical protein